MVITVHILLLCSVNIIGGKNGLLLDNNKIDGESGGKYYNGGYYNTMNINAGKSVNISGGEEFGIRILNKLANDDITMNIPVETGFAVVAAIVSCLRISQPRPLQGFK